jgi:hypothetical protein
VTITNEIDMKLEVVVIPVSDVDRAAFDAGAPGAQFHPAPDHGSYHSYATFGDPEDNAWLPL